MWTLTAVLICSICFHNILAETKILYSNGWIPITGDRIYNQINHKYTQLPPIMATHKIQIIYTDINKSPTTEKEVNRYEKIVNDAKDVTKIPDGEILCKDCIKESTKFQVDDSDFSPNTFKFPKQNETFGTARRSKHVENYKMENDGENMVIENGKINKNASQNELIKRYEVREEDDLDEKDEQEKRMTNTGYNYEPPKNEFKNNLHNILSKYIIKETDELSNYALSRRPKAQVPSKSILPPLRYSNNNLNHLPPDPLLAVFLSNYGYYLQGLYGIQNNYNNLYGYLASNNIHNNKPFGVYKIFSDTDSLH